MSFKCTVLRQAGFADSINDASDNTEIKRLEVATFPLSEERGVESNSPSEKTDEWV
jgi:hypothetical protein